MRNKAPLIWTTVFAAIALAFSFQKYETVRRMKHVAPYHARMAQFLVDEGKFTEALREIHTALAFEPSNPTWLHQKASLLQILGKLDHAESAFLTVLKLEPENKRAAANLQVTRELRLAAAPPARDRVAAHIRFYELLLEQNRAAEAQVAVANLQSEREYLQTFWSNRFFAAGYKGSVRLEKDGFFDVVLRDGAITLEGLRGMPIKGLGCINQPITTLEPLRSAPLRGLGLIDTRVTDLSPLRGMALNDIALHYSPIRNIEPLSGMPLTSVTFSDYVQDLTPLPSMERLTHLEIHGTRTATSFDISALARTKLQYLSLNRLPISNVAAVVGLPLQTLKLMELPVKDLAPLRRLRAQRLELARLPIHDVSALADLRLKILHLSHCPNLTNIDPLTNIATLETLILPESARDIEKLKALPNLKEIGMDGPPVPAAEFWQKHASGRLADLPRSEY